MDDKKIGSPLHLTSAGRLATSFRRMSACTALLAAVVAGMVPGMAGCRHTNQKIELASAFTAPKRDLDYTKEILYANARRWTNLAAGCQIAISSPQIPGHRVIIPDGNLVFSKPGSIRIIAPDSDQPSLRIVGDGKTYRVDMPLFSSTYSGKYSDAVTPQQGRINFLPAEMATALEPSSLLAERAPMLTQLEWFSGLYSLVFVATPVAAVKPIGLIVVDRRSERPASVEEYNLEDSSLRARILYLRFETLPVPGEDAVFVPNELRIIYPEEQTTIDILLHDITLNGKINPAQFKVAG